MNKYSKERKALQKSGDIPSWYTTQGYQLFKEKYQWAETPRKQYEAIAATAAGWLKFTKWEDEAYDQFFNLLWSGWLSPSTPILANMGTARGLPVSCSGGYIDDSIDGFYTSRRETAILTKHGFGTSGYLGDIRGRGSNISIGGVASGILPVFRGFVRDMQEVSQGATRRGAWAGYLPLDHGDFDELCDLLHTSDDDLNVGWVVTDKFNYMLGRSIEVLESVGLKPEDFTLSLLNQFNANTEEYLALDTLRRYQKAIKVKMITGKGYFFFVDKANKHRPECYKELGLDIKASNLCTEIMLHSSEDYTFTCVLSSMNLAEYDEWRDTEAVFWATLFLDCVAEEFIWRAKDIPGLEKAVAFTEKGRALGLGVCGLHTLFQQRGLPFDSLEAQFLNDEVFRELKQKTMVASHLMASEMGEPEWCYTTGRRNTHLLAIAPTKSTALIMGGISEGINPDPAMVYTQATSAGEVERVNPRLLKLMKERGVYNEETINRIAENYGGIQKENWLTKDEKRVFRTAFEIDQRVIIRLASQRQRYVDQGQSINLFFSADAEEEYISEVHQQAFNDENILSLYYCYSTKQSVNPKGCESCQ